ncbi:MAG: hypothetical protein QM493_07695 [Sulfurovum sp.]
MLMYYPEFKKASKKHLIACECLIASLDTNCKQNEINILTTLYYLTGYIFETILKFSIYSAIEYDRKIDISKISSHGLKYTKNSMQTHHLIYLKELMESKSINRLTDYDNNKNLFSKWDSEIRYKEKVTFTKEEILSFFEFAKQTYITLQQYK